MYIFFELDISNANQIMDIVAKVERIAPIDVLFNNAGYVLAGALEATSDEQLEQQFNTNVFGTIRLTRAFLPYFRTRKTGTIITTTSLICRTFRIHLWHSIQQANRH